MKFPISYVNGNCIVNILQDGTKLRFIDGDVFKPERPETLDINISNYCENNCPWCYLDATTKGRHGNLGHPFFDTIPKYTEIAINYARHPGIEDFLINMKKNNLIVNITINEIDLINDWMDVLYWQQKGLIYGIGVSITKKNKNIWWIVENFNSIIAHTIYDITSLKDYEWISKIFDKVLILGYKNKGRGCNITPKNEFNIIEVYDLFDVVSFDNLGIEQSGIKDYISEEEWEKSYMGEEGTASFYIDTVEEKYYKSSVEESGFDIGSKSAIRMFNKIRRG